MIRITQHDHQAVRMLKRTALRRLHQRALQVFGGEEGIRGRDLYNSWPLERQNAFEAWAIEMQLPQPFLYVEEFEVAFPAADVTPERTES